MTTELPETYCGKTIQEWHECAARDALKLYRLRRDVENVIKDIDNGVSEEGIVGRLKAAIIRSGTSND